MKRIIHVGKVYTHFKGNQYKVEYIALHTETNEEMVIYRDINNQKKVYARPYDMFVSVVDTDKYPNTKQVYRFEEQENS